MPRTEDPFSISTSVPGRTERRWVHHLHEHTSHRKLLRGVGEAWGITTHECTLSFMLDGNETIIARDHDWRLAVQSLRGPRGDVTDAGYFVLRKAPAAVKFSE